MHSISSSTPLPISFLCRIPSLSTGCLLHTFVWPAKHNPRCGVEGKTFAFSVTKSFSLENCSPLYWISGNGRRSDSSCGGTTALERKSYSVTP